MSTKPNYAHQYFARVIRDQHTRTITLQLVDPDTTVEINPRDEFITLGTVVDLSERPA